MKTRLWLFLGMLGAAPMLFAAEKQMAAFVDDYPFWTAKKRGEVRQFVPGLTAVLQLSETQREQIAAAREEMAHDEGVKAARRIGKSDPNVTADARANARAAIERATARLRETVATILTPEQKALIEKIDAAYAAAAEETGVLYADKFASVKGDDAARVRIQEEKNNAVNDAFRQKLASILSASQKEAMNRLTRDEEQRADDGVKKRRPEN